MLTITDLTVSKEMNQSEMSAVLGGTTISEANSAVAWSGNNPYTIIAAFSTVGYDTSPFRGSDDQLTPK